MAVSTSSRRRIAGLAVFLVGFFWFGCRQDADELTAPGVQIPTQEVLKPAINVQTRHTDRLMAIPGVVGTAVGLDEDGQPAIKVFTREAAVSGLPESLEGVPVAVEVTGMIVALSAVSDPTARFPRPVPIGVSTGHPDITAGTIGVRVTDGTNVYALSNNHVYANSNDAAIGDAVIQPGTFDGGSSPADDIGNLSDFEPIDFSGADNTIDAAIASTTTLLLGTATPYDGYGAPNSTTVSAFVGQNVQKFGRTTGLTQGQVSEVNVTVNVCYECAGPFCFNCKKLAKFVDQIAVTPGDFSGGGDSGSLVVTDDSNKNPVGLLFAGSSTRTICNPIDAVLTRFNVTIDDGGSPPPAVTDISVTDVSAPASVVQGDAASVDVTIQNVGNQDVTSDINVTLNDDTDGVPVGDQTISGGLTAGASTTLTYSWNTGSSTTDNHTLTASQDFTDDDASNNSNNAVVTVESAITDIAISAVNAPGSAVQGDVVSVDVTVENVGNQDVTSDINVTLTEAPDGINVGSQTLSGGLAAGASTTLTYSWNTGAASLGDHSLTASHDVADDDASNDSNSTVVTVNEPSAGVTVTSIDPNTTQAGTPVDVTITGSGFVAGASVTFENGSGPTPTASNVVVVDANTITATVTVKSGGPPRNRVFDVRVTNSDASTDVLADGFTVTP